MSNDDRVKELNKRISTSLPHSDNLPTKTKVTPNASKLKELAKEIRDSVEDYTIEAPVHPKST